MRKYAMIAVLVSLATPAITNAQKPIDAQKVVAVDATGKVVAEVLGEYQSFASVLLGISGGRLALVHVGRNGLFRDAEPTLFFESANCSGTPFIFDQYHSSPFVPSVVNGGALYAARQAAVPQTIAYNSVISDGGTCSGPLSEAQVLSPVVEASLEIDLAAEFLPPFSIEREKKPGKP